MPESVMPVRIGLVTCAHLHVVSYVHALRSHADADVVGIWDHDEPRGRDFAAKYDLSYFETLDGLLDASDAVIVVSENVLHADHCGAALEAGKHVMCEKPLVTDVADGIEIIDQAKRNGLCLMTAFPCRFSPAWIAVKEKIAVGEIGRLRAITATNRGTCPGGWFTQPKMSGGGAMIDHVVHVADLLHDLLAEEPLSVYAQTGSNMYGEEWDDTAMLSLQYRDGVFVSLDSSWSRPKQFRTWGDVTMTLVGDEGVIEMDMFGQEIQHYHEGDRTHTVGWYGSDLDRLMVDEFIQACTQRREPRVTGEHGLAASKVALAGYRSLTANSPVAP